MVGFDPTIAPQYRARNRGHFRHNVSLAMVGSRPTMTKNGGQVPDLELLLGSHPGHTAQTLPSAPNTSSQASRSTRSTSGIVAVIP